MPIRTFLTSPFDDASADADVEEDDAEADDEDDEPPEQAVAPNAKNAARITDVSFLYVIMSNPP